MNRHLLYCFFFLVTPICLPAQASSQDFDLEEVLASYPERVSRLFAELDLELPELRAVASRVNAGDNPGACRALIAYYRSESNFRELRWPAIDSADLAEADRLLSDTFTFQGITARQPRRSDGALDWAHGGPTGDEEWAHLLNRHEWLGTLLDAYRFSGDERYAQGLNDFLLDWILTNPYPVEDECCPQWRTLETALRFNTWPSVFYGLQESESFTEAVRILMLISIAEHGALIQRFHWTHQNHALFELKGLARISVYWPEFRVADEWFDYAARHMLYEMEGQVRPDGVQDELTSLYHYHALRQFQEVMDLAVLALRELPPPYRSSLEKMYHYLAYTLRPDGFSLLNNDSDRNDYRAEIAQAATVFRRPDWEYIISNGKRGDPPAQSSVLFPYAGQVILRDNWQPQAQWSFFDGGPDGTAHRHYDKLHLSLAAGGRDLLVDSGRYWYKSDVWREYFVSSFGHNVVLVDGFGHRPDATRYETPGEVAFETTDRYTYAQATFDAGFRQVDDAVRHTRGVLHLSGHFWIVIDHLEAEERHTIQPLWHFHPACHVVAGGQEVYSDDAVGGNLLIRPSGAGSWKLELNFGPDHLADPDAYREWKPRPFGEFPIRSAYSVQYNQKQSNTVAVYHGDLNSERTFAWLLIPFEGSNRPKRVRVTLRQKEGGVTVKARVGRQRLRVVVDLENKRVVTLKEKG